MKKACQLYKDVKSAAGDVRGVLADLEAQFKGRHKDKPPTAAEVKQFNEEKRRVEDVAKTDPGDVYARVSDQLGDFFDALDKIEELLWQEERAAKRVYTGDVSLKRRALQRVMIRTRLEAMQKEMREIMVYQSPAELGDLWTRFEAMRAQINAEQEQARAEQARVDAREAWRRAQFKVVLQDRALYLLAIGVVLLEMWGLLWAINLHRTGRWSSWW